MKQDFLDNELNEHEMVISIKIKALTPKFVKCWDIPLKSKSSDCRKKQNTYALNIIQEEEKIENRKQSSSVSFQQDGQYQRWAQQEISQHQKFSFAASSKFIAEDHYDNKQKHQKQKNSNQIRSRGDSKQTSIANTRNTRESLTIRQHRQTFHSNSNEQKNKADYKVKLNPF